MSSSEQRITLAIPSAGPLTEVRLLDGAFTPVPLSANTGAIQVSVVPGIYQLGYKLADGWTSQTLIVRPDGADAPELPKTLRPTIASVAGDIIGDVTEWLDIGSMTEGIRRTIGLPSAGDAALTIEFDLPEEARIGGLPFAATLAAAGGDTSLDQYQVTEEGIWAVEMPAGTRLLTIGSSVPLQLALTICEGWSTHCYVPLMRDVDQDVLRVAIDSIRIRYRRRGSGAVGRDIVELENEALNGLASGQALFGEPFEELIAELIDEKAESPMLGILAGYLCAGPERRSRAFFRRLIDMLTHLLGDPGHPDIVALEARYRLDNGIPLDDLPPLRAPPSLLPGWRHILEASAHCPQLIPAGSLCERASLKLWTNRLWTAWAPAEVTTQAVGPRSLEQPPPPGAETEGAVQPAELDFEEARRIIIGAAEEPQLREWILRNREAQEEGDPGRASADPVHPSPEELAVANAIRPLRKIRDEKTAERLAVQFNQGPASSLGADRIAAAMGLPQPLVERAASSLASKLLSMAQDPGVAVRVRTTMAAPELIIPYDPRFLGDGFVVPMPTLRDSLKPHAFADGAPIDYTHYSLVMRKDRRIAVFAANNVNAAQKVTIPGSVKWKMDERVGAYQIGPETYDDNQVDKGHLAKREDVLYGPVPEARAANKATFFYTNAAPQHKNFNQDEWKKLEDWVLTRAVDFSYRLCVFTGPIVRFDDPLLTDLPPELRTLPPEPAQLPYGFWKVIVLRDEQAGGAELSVIGFAMKQSEMWTSRGGGRLLNLKLHQVPLSAIEDWAEIDFGPLRDIDQLSFDAFGPRALDVEWPRLESAEDIVWPSVERRGAGISALREAIAPAVSDLRSTEPSRAAECCSDSFDPQGAIAALSSDVARLTQLVGTLAAQSGAPVSEAADGSRSLDAEPVAAPPEGPGGEDPKVAQWLEVAPAGMESELATFAREVTRQSAIARGELPPDPVETVRIVGGEAVPYGSFLDCVFIGEAERWMCTGALVAPRVVLTAAHCGAAITRIMVGANNVNSALARIVPVRSVFVHPSYRRHPLNENDITLLVLDAPANVPPVRLASEAELAAAAAVELVGFGYNDPMRPLGFGEKRRATVRFPPVFRRDPATDFSLLEQRTGLHADYEFLAGRKGLGIDSCNGDSGGPAYVATNDGFKLAGLTSRATRERQVHCGDGGIYVRPDRFIDWIAQTIAAAGLPPL